MEPTKDDGQEEVYFIRHKPVSQSETGRTKQDLEDLKEQERISIFYDNRPINEVVDNYHILKGKYPDGNIQYKDAYFSKTKDNKSKYRSALNMIWRLGKYGGLVVSEYNNDAHCLIGNVPPNTKIELFTAKHSNFEFNVTLKLEGTITIAYSDCPVLPAVRPPFQTICNPTSSFFKEIIPAIYRDGLGSVQPARSLLHPKMLEQMCVEYLRTVGYAKRKLLKYCILRPGKNLPTIDIAGVSADDRKIYAQVKADEIKPKAIDTLKQYMEEMEDTSNAVYVVFCEGVRGRGTVEGITYIDVDTVFDHFNSSETGQGMIKRMIGFPE
jgi:hypothetical protein